MSDDFDPDDESEGGEAEDSPPILQPRENPDLTGHAAAETALLEAYRSGRLPHAWLLTGPRGIGKATLAFRFARFLLAQSGQAGGLFAAPPVNLRVGPDDPVFRRIAAGAHGDLLLIEKAYDPKRRRYRSEIVVEDVRQIADFFHLTSAEGGWRIVIIDGADDMNRNAANSLLKVLEEPAERALLLVTTLSAGRLLPTILSRCRRLPMNLLSDSQVSDLLKKYRPGLGSEETVLLVRLAEGSIGRALDLAEAGGLGLYRELGALLASLPSLNAASLDGFADRMGRFGGESAFRLMAELLSGWLARMVTGAASGRSTAILPEEGAAMTRLAARASLDRWGEVWEKLNRLFGLVDAVNLDRKQAVLNAFFTLEEASR